MLCIQKRVWCHVESVSQTLKVAVSLSSVHVKPSPRKSELIRNPLSFDWNSQGPLLPRGPVQFRIQVPHLGTPAWSQAILLVWRPLCYVSGLVGGWGGPCYWKAHLSCSPYSLLASYNQISRRGKCPISVRFYFVMKVSIGCEKQEMHHKSLPWENRVESPLICAGPIAWWVDVLFNLSTFTFVVFDVLLQLTDKRRQSRCFFLPSASCSVYTVCLIPPQQEFMKRKGWRNRCLGSIWTGNWVEVWTQVKWLGLKAEIINLMTFKCALLNKQEQIRKL